MSSSSVREVDDVKGELLPGKFCVGLVPGGRFLFVLVAKHRRPFLQLRDLNRNSRTVWYQAFETSLRNIALPGFYLQADGSILVFVMYKAG